MSNWNKPQRLWVFILIIVGCNSNTPSEKETFEFLVQMIDKKDVHLYEGQSYTKISFKVVDIDKCSCEYGYTSYNGRYVIRKFSFVDAFGSSLSIGSGMMADPIEISFEKESVENIVYYPNGKLIEDLANPWLRKLTIWVKKGEGENIEKGFSNLIYLCNKKNKSDLFD